MKITPQNSLSHVSKDSPWWGSLTKRLQSFHSDIHNHLHILFLQGFLFTYDAFTSLDPTNNMKLLNANYEPKAPISTPYIFEKKKEWIVNHIHLHLFPMYQTNHRVSITFHPSMDKFYIIENLGFGQVYILELPLLLTQNSYLNYS
jgi:hypothetical protein